MNERELLHAHTPYYQEQLIEAWPFQDFVQGRLREYDWPIGNYQTRAAQLEHGENDFGLEIKHDKQFAETSNFYIETAEKSDLGGADWVPSGIYSPSDPMLYGLGNYDEFWVFSTYQLRRMVLWHEARKLPLVFTNKRGTSRGFLLTPDWADRCLVRRFDWLVDPPIYARIQRRKAEAGR